MLKKLEAPYLTDNNRYYTQQLFYEMWLDVDPELRVIEPVFTLTYDRPGLVNARTTFIEMNDPTGYQWAMKYLKSWKHWDEWLLKAKWFREALDSWLAELEVKTRSEALTAIKDISTGGSGQSLAAAKYLAEQGWVKGASRRGRPSKEELTGELKARAEALEKTNADMQRIGLTVIQGGVGT